MTPTTREQIDRDRALIAKAIREAILPGSAEVEPHQVLRVQDKLAPLPEPEYPTVEVPRLREFDSYIVERRSPNDWRFVDGGALAGMSDARVRVLASLLPENQKGGERRYTVEEIEARAEDLTIVFLRAAAERPDIRIREHLRLSIRQTLGGDQK